MGWDDKVRNKKDEAAGAAIGKATHDEQMEEKGTITPPRGPARGVRNAGSRVVTEPPANAQIPREPVIAVMEHGLTAMWASPLSHGPVARAPL